MNIPQDHPRYKSLIIREKMVELVERGLVTPTGLISHGRGEAYDYLLGEKTTESAMNAERAAAAYLLRAKSPVVCVNGNAAGLDPNGLIELAMSIPAKIEVNIFHRTDKRMEDLISYMEECGAKNVLGRSPDSRIPELSSDRALCTSEGIFKSDVILVPIEDGDRAEALVKMGKIVIAIDLNPLSRTSKTATVSIADELSRALENITSFITEMKKDPKIADDTIRSFSNLKNRKETVMTVCRSLKSEFER